ncbi:MAG TPA: DUF72 domain-containing protein [Candidatus Udaeobacter sp.]|nr:DUF72 domain-containing protein [Candidatus Udaeobacter sp.]
MGDSRTGDLFAPDPSDLPANPPQASRRRGPPAWDSNRQILVGTSGWSFPDWIGRFYPLGLPRTDMLGYYAEHFPIVEVNSTYYRIPPPAVTEQMARKTPPGFRFTVKGPHELTHEQRLDPEAMAAFRECLLPLAESGKLDGVLLQFPWSFRPGPASWELLGGARRAIADVPLTIEFRHEGWAQPSTFNRLRELDLGYCVVDEPKLPGLMPPLVETTSPIGYVRFHGRNSQNWWAREGGRDRYDYLYSDAELREWTVKIHELAQRAEKVYVFFNNCHAGQAARNAALMQELLLSDAGGGT